MAGPWPTDWLGSSQFVSDLHIARPRDTPDLQAVRAAYHDAYFGSPAVGAKDEPWGGQGRQGWSERHCG